MKIRLALLFACVSGCHSGEPRGTEAPVDPLVGTWRSEAQEASLVLFSTTGQYRAVGIQIAGLTDGRWRRYSKIDIILERAPGAAFTVDTAFDAAGDRVTLSWSTLIFSEEPFPVSNTVTLVRVSLFDAADGGGRDGATPVSPGTP